MRSGCARRRDGAADTSPEMFPCSIVRVTDRLLPVGGTAIVRGVFRGLPWYEQAVRVLESGSSSVTAARWPGAETREISFYAQSLATGDHALREAAREALARGDWELVNSAWRWTGRCGAGGVRLLVFGVPHVRLRRRAAVLVRELPAPAGLAARRVGHQRSRARPGGARRNVRRECTAALAAGPGVGNAVSDQLDGGSAPAFEAASLARQRSGRA
jgi:hypothetical protein